MGFQRGSRETVILRSGSSSRVEEDFRRGRPCLSVGIRPEAYERVRGRVLAHIHGPAGPGMGEEGGGWVGDGGEGWLRQVTEQKRLLCCGRDSIRAMILLETRLT